MSLFSLAVAVDENARNARVARGLPAIAFFRALPNAPQHSHASLNVAVRNVSQQFMPEFRCGCVDGCDYPLGSPPEQHHFATAMMWRASSRDPGFFFQSM